jgi:hypothetical protein
LFHGLAITRFPSRFSRARARQVAERHDKRRRGKNERETVAACGKAPATERTIYDVSPGNTLIPSVASSPFPLPAVTRYCTLLSYRGRYEAFASASGPRDATRLYPQRYARSIDRSPRRKRRSERSSKQRAWSGIVASRSLEYHSSTRLSRDLWRLCCNTGSMPRDRLKRIRTLRRTEECPCG